MIFRSASRAKSCSPETDEPCPQSHRQLSNSANVFDDVGADASGNRTKPKLNERKSRTAPPEHSAYDRGFAKMKVLIN